MRRPVDPAGASADWPPPELVETLQDAVIRRPEGTAGLREAAPGPAVRAAGRPVGPRAPRTTSGISSPARRTGGAPSGSTGWQPRRVDRRARGPARPTSTWRGLRHDDRRPRCERRAVTASSATVARRRCSATSPCCGEQFGRHCQVEPALTDGRGPGRRRPRRPRSTSATTSAEPRRRAVELVEAGLGPRRSSPGIAPSCPSDYYGAVTGSAGAESPRWRPGGRPVGSAVRVARAPAGDAARTAPPGRRGRAVHPDPGHDVRSELGSDPRHQRRRACRAAASPTPWTRRPGSARRPAG